MFNSERVIVKLISSQKREKEERIIEEALLLFEEKGIDKTSIRDIMKKAKYGLGTFYLYFKDKKDLEEKIVTDLMVDLLYDAEKATKGQTPTERYTSFIGYIMDYLVANPTKLSLVSNNINWALYSKIENDHRFKEADTGLKFILSKYRELFTEDHTEEEQLFILALTFHTVIFTCKSALMEDNLLSIDQMKAVLFKTVEKIFR